MSIVKEYKRDLKNLKKLKNKFGSNDGDSKQVSNMIGSTEYSLFWIEHGYERPTLDISITRMSKANREQLWGEIEHADGINMDVSDVYFWEDSEERILTERQIEMQRDADYIMKSFSNQELNVFMYRYCDLLEVKEIANLLGKTEKAIQRTLDRASSKIKSYFSSEI